jgi:hypothetical protein
MKQAPLSRPAEPAPEDAAEPSAEVIDLRRERARRAHPSWRNSIED